MGKRNRYSAITTMTPVESESVQMSPNGYYNTVILDVDGDEEEKIAKISAADVVENARTIFKSGRTRDVKFRKEQLRALLRFLVECREEIVKALYADLRKHRQEVIMGELDLVENDIRHTVMELGTWAKPQRPEKRLVNLLDGVYVYNDPYGVVLIIGAWNYPILLTLGPIIGAIAGGNCVILKPSELSPSTAQLLADYLPKYLDKGAYHVFLGGIEETRDLLEIKFDYIFFTGSTTVGKIVHQAAAKHLTPTTLELGGKNPVYLDDTADIENATRRILWGKLFNSGQTCISPDYLLCTEEVQREFLKKAKQVLKEFYGNDQNPPGDLSRIVTERHYKRLVNFLDTNKIALGGKCYAKERLICPTILVDVPPENPVMGEEIFGPILVVCNVKNVEEAVEFINARDKPLALYVFTKNSKTRRYILDNTSSGAVAVNDTIVHILTENLPFGGVGASGMGAYHGEHGFQTFTHQKAVLVRGMGAVSEMLLSARYPPYSNFKTQFTSVAMKKRYGVSTSFLKKLGIFGLGMGFAYLLCLF